MCQPKQNIHQTFNSQKAPHSMSSRVSYGLSIVRISEKIDHIIMVLDHIRCQAVTSTNDELLSIGPSGTKLSETLIKYIFLQEVAFENGIGKIVYIFSNPDIKWSLKVRCLVCLSSRLSGISPGSRWGLLSKLPVLTTFAIFHDD